ncbi:MAG TPA: trimeric intracellular cation channel family protein [Opitutaceae bacterium]|nr:trimeric intracellular cation channel family protein [Opitutaceae bacterium]
MISGTFELPVWFDLGATFAFALSGALAAIKRGYDIVGTLALALVSGIGGGLIRDGLFLQGEITPLLTNPAYMYTITAATVVSFFFQKRVHHFFRLIAWVDALGLGAYAVFGVQKSLGAGLPVSAAVFVGVINAVGGGLLRDVLTREEPLVFKPGQFYLLTALVGAVTFICAGVYLDLTATNSAFLAMAVTFLFRSIAIAFNWRTAPIASGTIFRQGGDTQPPFGDGPPP